MMLTGYNSLSIKSTGLFIWTWQRTVGNLKTAMFLLDDFNDYQCVGKDSAARDWLVRSQGKGEVSMLNYLLRHETWVGPLADLGAWSTEKLHTPLKKNIQNRNL
jgi:hypothetical protein